MAINTVVRLARRPRGLVTRQDFEIRDEAVPEPREGEFRVKAEYISLDPAMRGWMNEGRSYVPPVGLGEVMRGFAVGYVEGSRHKDFRDGEAVVGRFGVQRYAISDGTGVTRADPETAPLQTWVGGLGMPGLTAYFGLLDLGQPKESETVVVSAASGAVGQVVGQIAKIRGCRAVGIAGGTEKCRVAVEEFGFDACVDYKAGQLAEQLRSACPTGIDVYYENVGGDILDTVLAQMNRFGRIPVCGLISAYTATEAPPGPKNLRSILVNRLRVQGFIVFDFASRYEEALNALAQWYRDGKLRFREDIRTGGIEAYPDVLNLLFTGENVGKLVLKVGE
jgi:NADPH-dependent curcumin reductase CurA